jgi:hypothetical protein
MQAYLAHSESSCFDLCAIGRCPVAGDNRTQMIHAMSQCRAALLKTALTDIEDLTENDKYLPLRMRTTYTLIGGGKANTNPHLVSRRIESPFDYTCNAVMIHAKNAWQKINK